MDGKLGARAKVMGVGKADTRVATSGAGCCRDAWGTLNARRSDREVDREGWVGQHGTR